VSLVEKPTYSTTHLPEALSLQNSTYAQSANDSDQPVLQARKKQRRWSPEDDLPAMLPPATSAQKTSSTAQQQLAASQSYSEGSQTRPERTLNTSAASPHKSALPQGTLVASTAQPQQAGHTYSRQISMGPHLPNNLKSQGAVVTAQGTTPEQLQAWRTAGRPKCIKCEKCHPPPCSAKKVAESLARAAEKRLIAEQNAARHAPAQQRLPIHRAQIIPPPVWGSPPGTNAWPALQAPSAALATIPAARAQVSTQLPYYPQPASQVADQSLYYPQAGAQVASQLPYHHQPGAPLRAWTSTGSNRDQFIAMLPSLFATPPPDYTMRYFAALYDGTEDHFLDQLLDQFQSGPMSSNATQQHSTINAAAPGNGNQATAPLSTTDTRSVNARIPEGSRPSGGVKGKRPRSQ
jgi:hypothetical protein